MNRICHEHVDNWIKTFLGPIADTKQTFDPSHEMVKLTFHIIMESAFEYKATDAEFEHVNKHFEIALREYSTKQALNSLRKVFGRFIPEVQRALASCNELITFATHLLKSCHDNRSKSAQNTAIKLIDGLEGFDKSAKAAEIIVFIAAGYDTTGFSVANTLVLLGKHPGVTSKARQSLGGGVQQSDYLRNVFTESNRLYPVAAAGSVRFLERDLHYPSSDKTKQIVIPKGSNLYMPQIMPNYIESIFPDPHKFWPERWENATTEMKQAVLPFSYGNRNCLGQRLALAELDTVLPRLVSSYDFVLETEGELDRFLTFKFMGARMRVTTPSS